MFDTKPYEERFETTVKHFEEDLKKIQTGRAHPSILNGIKVEVYGSLLPINQTANITVPEPQLLQITPFDPNNLQAIASAIRANNNFQLNPSDDGRVVRVPIPPLTEDRRYQLVKQASEKVEEARITLRTTRQDAFKEAKRRKENRELSEDDIRRIEKTIDDKIADYNNHVEEIFKAKEKDILTI